MTKPANAVGPNLGSFLGLGSLLIVAGVLSFGIHNLHGEWPAGFGGWVGTLFLVFGAVFVGVSLVVKIRDRRAVKR